MLISLYSDGTTKNIDPDKVFQSENRASQIYVIAPFSANVQMTMHFELEATGQRIGPLLMDNAIDLDCGIQENVNIWKLDVQQVLTQYYGTVKYQILCRLGEQLVATGRGEFQVIEGVDVILPPEPTQGIYELILQKINFIEGKFINGWLEAKAFKPYDVNFAYSYDALTIGYANHRVAIYRSLMENNKGAELTDKRAWEKLSDLTLIDENGEAIKKLDNRVTQNRNDIDLQEPIIQSNTQRIDALEKTAISGIDYIGRFESREVLPTQEELTAFLFEKRQREQKAGDLIKFTKIIDKAPNINYDIISNGKEWGNPIEELLPEEADNFTQGTFQGTLYDNYSIRHNTAQGKIIDVLVKNSEGKYESIAPKINKLNDTQKGFIDGTIPVGVATKALQDQNGATINLTYAERKDTYTKAECDKRFANVIVTDLLHYSRDGIVDDTPTIPEDGKQFSKVLSNAGTFEIFNLRREIEGDLNISSNTKDKSSLWLETDKDCVLEFKMTTKTMLEAEERVLGVVLSGEITFKANTIKKVDITSLYNGLLNEELKINNITKQLEVIYNGSELINIDLYSGRVYDSTFNFVTQDIVYNLNYVGEPKSVKILRSEWVAENDRYKVVIPQLRHQQAPSNKYILDLQYERTATESERLVFSPIINENGDITIYTAEPFDCELLVASAVKEDRRGIVYLENPTTLPETDYNQIGAIRIKQTEVATPLTLPLPKNLNIYQTIFMSNAIDSTQPINVNGQEIAVNSGIKFKWNGTNWQVGELPDKTSEIYDDLLGQPLNDTLATISTKANKDGSNIQVEVWQNILGVDLKANNKSVELKSGLAVDNLIDFFKYFYDLRKGLDDTWEIEVGKGKNENIMNIFGFPYGESPSNSAELIIKRKATSGIGYTLELTFASEKSNTTHTAYVRGWILSGTSFDRDIHFTGWRNARGGQWVDEVNGEITLTDTNEIVLNIGEFKNPYNNFLIAEVTKNNHSYNSFLMLSMGSQNVGETTIKLDNEEVYVKLDYNAKTFTISKTSSGTETLKVHLYEKLI